VLLDGFAAGQDTNKEYFRKIHANELKKFQSIVVGEASTQKLAHNTSCGEKRHFFYCESFLFVSFISSSATFLTFNLRT